MIIAGSHNNSCVTLQPPSFQCSLGDSFESNFVKWFEKQPDKSQVFKTIALMGYCNLHYGAAQFYENAYSRDKDGMWQATVDELRNSIASKELQLEKIQESISGLVQERVSIATNALRLDLDASNQKLQDVRLDYEDRLARITADASVDFKHQLAIAKNEHELCLASLRGDLQASIQRANDLAYRIESERASALQRTEQLHRERMSEVQALKDQIQRLRDDQEVETKRCVELATTTLQHRLDLRDKDHENKILMLQNEKDRLMADEKSQAVQRMDALRQKYEIQLEHLRGEQDSECEKYRMLYADTKHRLDMVMSGVHAQRVADLQSALQEATDKLAVLQRSNAGKGVWGESILSKYLRDNFMDWEVSDTSQTKHSCDIWMKRSDKRFVAVESKYKASISTSDITKFASDVDYMCQTNGDMFMGAVFVSVKSKNIPSKGELNLEYSNGRPVLYVGFGCEDEMDGAFLKHCISLLIKVGEMITALAKHNADAAIVVKRVRPMLKTASTMQKTIDAIRTSCKKTVDHVNKLENDMRNVFNTINEVVSQFADD